MNIDWKRKLSSRKFWCAVAAFVAGIIIACNGGEATAQTVSGILMSGGAIVAYILGESWIDAASDSVPQAEPEDEEIDETEEFEVFDKNESEYK